MFFNKCHNILQKAKNTKKEKTVCKIMLLGPVNVGKSTLFNKIIDSERAIVTNIKGTTRDILSNEFVFEGKNYELFDTAGHRDKQGKIEKVGYKKEGEGGGGVKIVLICSFIEYELQKILSS